MVGVSYGTELGASAKWEKAVTRETEDATRIIGGKLVIGSMPPNHKVK
jgi:hypothetical protein